MVVGQRDDALQTLHANMGYVTRLQEWVHGGGLHNVECPLFPDGRLIVDVSEGRKVAGGKLHAAAVMVEKREAGGEAVLFLSMHSPTLDVGMRVELPLRSVLKGNGPLATSTSHTCTS